jgi:DNA-binding CsgD family transcriptional regulator
MLDRELLEGEPLTARELEVLIWAADGDTAGDTAKRLWLAEETIKGYRKKIIRKLVARNLANAVAIAMRTGILSCEEREAA